MWRQAGICLKLVRTHGEEMWKWLKSSKTSPISTPGPGNEPDAAAPDEAVRPKVILITGTSGAGRKSVAEQLSTDLGIPYVRSYTTRAIRPNEREGEHYHFITDAEFQAMAERQEFCQSTRLERGNYGISSGELTEALEQRQAAIVVVNREGVQVFRKLYGQAAIRIFLYVTKEDIRLREERQATPPEVIDEYLRNYSEQVIHKKESDYLLQNIDTAMTLEKIKAFLQDKI